MPPLPPALAKLAHAPPSPHAASRLAIRLLDLIFPPRCVGCQRVGAIFCAQCLAERQTVPRPVCRRCGRPTSADGLCPNCATGRFFVSAIRSAGLYANPLSRALRRFKYEGQTDLRRPLGLLLADYWRSRPVSADLVLAVPLHKRRLQERGYNQSQLLAVEFCRAVGLPLLADNVLHRERETRQQVLLGLADRHRNVAGAFSWQGPSLDGLKVLLIDDVATSGATLEACGEALHRAGVRRVWALTVARAVPRPPTGPRQAVRQT